MTETSNYSKYLFNNYRSTHGNYSGTKLNGETRKLFREIYIKDLKKIFDQFPKNARILEIGCNMGGMLYEMYSDGFKNLEGIDLSPDDLKIASKYLPSSTTKLQCADANDYLNGKKNEYDIVFSKAVFEHIKKENIIPLLEKCRQALKPEGIIIIRVPNMDWIISSHERYMDFTHEVGFNENSLGQVMRSVFGNCSLSFVNDDNERIGIKGKVARNIIKLTYKLSLPDINVEALFAREIMGISRNH